MLWNIKSVFISKEIYIIKKYEWLIKHMEADFSMYIYSKHAYIQNYILEIGLKYWNVVIYLLRAIDLMCQSVPWVSPFLKEI